MTTFNSKRRPVGNDLARLRQTIKQEIARSGGGASNVTQYAEVIANGNTEKDVTIPAVDLAKTFLTVSSYSANDNSENIMVKLTSTTNIKATRRNSTGSGFFTVFVIEN